MEPEKVIIRCEWNPHLKLHSFLACFPDDPANPGRICCFPLYFSGDRAVFEPCTEVSLDYYYRRTRIVHRGNPYADLVRSAIEKYCDTEFRVVEKIM